MTSLLLAACLATSAPSDDARLGAVRSVVGFARQVEEICRPRFRTTSETPVRVVPDLPVKTVWAQPRRVGGYHVMFGELNGFVAGDRVDVLFRRSEALPEGARLWTEDECRENARAVVELVKPAGYALGRTFSLFPEEAPATFRTEIVLPEDPRLVAGVVDIRIDAHTGLPEQATRGLVYPRIAPERLDGMLPEEELVAEALRVYRSGPALARARMARSTYVYEVPAFSRILNEMTEETRGYEARGEAVPLYQWAVNEDDGAFMRTRVVWVDARTGRGVAYLVHDLPWAGGAKGKAPAPADLAEGLWRLSGAVGSLAKVATESFDGVPVVLANAAGEVRTLRFDAKTGLVRDETGAYRPDATLLRAMRAQKAVRPFGKR